ncbi:MAG: hypothetical protein OEY86_06195 [Nitrospira sp.]|nr:hypothetical protein [Nitrospira sp.]
MASLNDVCKEIIGSVDGALGCGVVDLNTGLLLGVAHNVPYFTQSYLDAVAAASVDMVRGKTVKAVEDLLSKNRGNKVVDSIKEVQMATENTLHFIATVTGKPNAMVVLITNKKVNLGMGWAGVRNNMTKIAPMCP